MIHELEDLKTYLQDNNGIYSVSRPSPEFLKFNDFVAELKIANMSLSVWNLCILFFLSQVNSSKLDSIAAEMTIADDGSKGQSKGDDLLDLFDRAWCHKLMYNTFLNSIQAK